jgi:crotonobetainyl-CoA:carnitine CoA-transferase CaiB-like acyl-CoA transferase
MAIIEPILTILGAQPTVYDQLGLVPERIGNRSDSNAPRNTYRTSDGRWLAVSTSSQRIAERLMRLVGREELTRETWFASGRGRAQHADELDAAVAEWIGRRTAEDVVGAFEEAEAAVAPVYTIEDVLADPQYRALGSIVTVPDDQLGPIRMQNVMFRLSETPGAIRWTGPMHGQHNDEVYGELGVDAARLEELAASGVV